MKLKIDAVNIMADMHYRSSSAIDTLHIRLQVKHVHGKLKFIERGNKF